MIVKRNPPLAVDRARDYRGAIMTTENFHDLLGRIALFSALEEKELERIAHGVHERHLKRGEILFQKGDPSTGFYYLLEGQVKLVLLAPDGHEKVVELVQQGMTFGEAVMFIDRPYPAYAEALRASRLLFVPKGALFEALHSSPEFAMRLLAGLSQRLHSLIREIEEVTTQNALQRVIGYLLGELDDHGSPNITLPASKAIIASRLNLTPETFSRVLHTLQEQQLVSVEGRTITLLDPVRMSGKQE